MSNQPEFDPLNATPEQSDAMLAGYLDGGPSGPGFRQRDDIAYEHGWRVRRNDAAGLADNDQRELARRFAKRA